MTLGRRLRTFLVGFGMGLIMVYFMFGDRMGDWFPENRIKQRLDYFPMMVGNEVGCLLDCHNIHDSIIKQVFITGEVLLSESEPRSIPNPIYLLESEDKSFKIKCEAKDSTETIVLDFIPTIGKECDC